VRARGEIIGIVKDMKVSTLSETTAPATYLAYNTLPLGASFAIRTTATPSTTAAAIRAEVRGVDPSVAIYELGTMDDAIAQSVAEPRFFTAVLGAFAAGALLLATLGVYGVIAYIVSQRKREFGIRIALGATAAVVGRTVLRRGIVLAVLGTVVGVGTALLLTRTIQSMLFGVAPLDPVTFASVPVVLAVAAILASWLPARRAARVDPVVAMRAE
jgi:ABC-type antimicrobial peptide transport system permease subunit